LLKSRGIPTTRSVALAYKNLCVRGTGSADDVTYAPTIGTIIAPWTARRYKKRQVKLTAARQTDEQKEAVKDEREESLKKGERFLVRDFSGVVKPGEMMLVVGRPGSGCTTFLKALSGLHQGYAGVDGKVYIGNMDSDKAIAPYKSDVVFNPEEDIHDPNLHVGHTLDFALRNNTPSPMARLPTAEGGDAMTADEYRDREKSTMLKVFGLEHTHDTKVGDQYVRGVSGGEKKRVSIAEVLTSKASVQMWDNATRGLDADTALRYTKVIRTLCDIERNAAVITVYQAGNGIYDCFDKVTVIADGRVLYYGPREEARGYFEDLGFVHPDGGNTADFLTSVTAVSRLQLYQMTLTPRQTNAKSRRAMAKCRQLPKILPTRTTSPT
jgi:ATP-binding cassette subfamily G (WHITE) protein 2 (SNQ2)